MPFNLGIGEVLIILVVALLVYGGRLPEVGRSLGKSLRSFKEGLRNPSLPAPADEEEEAEGAEEAGEPDGEVVEREAEGKSDGNGSVTPDRSP